MQASVVVKRMPYVILPSPFSRTSLFLSVTSCKKLEQLIHIIMLSIALQRVLAARLSSHKLSSARVGFPSAHKFDKPFKVIIPADRQID